MLIDYCPTEFTKWERAGKLKVKFNEQVMIFETPEKEIITAIQLFFNQLEEEGKVVLFYKSGIWKNTEGNFRLVVAE